MKAGDLLVKFNSGKELSYEEIDWLLERAAYCERLARAAKAVIESYERVDFAAFKGEHYV